MKEFNHDRGSYWKEDNYWWVRAPNGLYGRLVSHKVIENENGTITVSPSILITHPPGQRYHGYLEKGKWRTLKDSTEGIE